MDDRISQSHIRQILQEISPNSRIAKPAIDELTRVVTLFIVRIGRVYIAQEDDYNRSSIKIDELVECINKITTGELRQYMIRQVELVVWHYTDIKETQPVDTRMSKSQKAGIIISPVQVGKIIRKTVRCHSISENFTVGLAGAVEYLIIQILENAIAFSKAKDRVTIKLEDIRSGIIEDTEIARLF